MHTSATTRMLLVTKDGQKGRQEATAVFDSSHFGSAVEVSSLNFNVVFKSQSANTSVGWRGSNTSMSSCCKMLLHAATWW